MLKNFLFVILRSPAVGETMKDLKYEILRLAAKSGGLRMTIFKKL